MLIQHQGGLDHVQTVEPGRIQLDQFTRKEIRLLLVVALDAHPIAAVENRLQQRQGVCLVDELAVGEGSRRLGAREITVAQMVEFHNVFLVRGGVLPI